MTRHGVSRLLDTLGGMALGVLLLLAIQASSQAWATPDQPPVSQTWNSGPWAGCTLVSIAHLETLDGQTQVHEIQGIWACHSDVPPSLITPTAR